MQTLVWLRAKETEISASLRILMGREGLYVCLRYKLKVS